MGRVLFRRGGETIGEHLHFAALKLKLADLVLRWLCLCFRFCPVSSCWYRARSLSVSGQLDTRGASRAVILPRNSLLHAQKGYQDR